MTQHGVYALRHRSGREYIGSSTDIPRRIAQHWTDLRGGRHHNERLQHTFTRDGAAAFTAVVLEVTNDIFSARAREAAVLAERPLVYNTTPVLCPGAIVNSKLTAAQAREIWERAARGEESNALAAEYGVHHTTIRRIRRGASWGLKQLPDGRSHARGRKLTAKDIPAIRASHAAGETHISIANAFGVTYGMIGHIIAGRAWKRA